MSDYDGESSSTERELELLNEKLMALETQAHECLPMTPSIPMFESPAKSHPDESSIASDSGQDYEREPHSSTLACTAPNDCVDVVSQEQEVLAGQLSDTALEAITQNFTTTESSKARNPYNRHRATQEVQSMLLLPKLSLPDEAQNRGMTSTSSSASSFSSRASYNDDSSSSDEKPTTQDIVIDQTSEEIHAYPCCEEQWASPTTRYQVPKVDEPGYQARHAKQDSTTIDVVKLEVDSRSFQTYCSHREEIDQSPYFADTRKHIPPRTVEPNPTDGMRSRSPSTQAHNDSARIGDPKSEKNSVNDQVPAVTLKQKGSTSSSDTTLSPATFAVCDASVPTCDQAPEIHFSLYSPPEYKLRKPPVLHKFNQTNRPKASRRQLPVSHFFQAPASMLWKGRFEKFNGLQSELANQLCHSDDHIIVSAPTGAGKTAIFEMAMARFITVDLQLSGKQRMSKNRKMVYIAPSRALCEERYHDWTKRLEALNIGIEVRMITGDSDDPSACYHNLSSAHLILTTPEKWDSISRKWTENFFLLASVKLVMIDEVHLLGDETRGHSLEAIIIRSKSIQRAARHVNAEQGQIDASSYPHTTPEAISSSLRTVAVSATLPNIIDVADFMCANEAYAFDGSFRPVPLTKHVTGCGFLGKNEFQFWNHLNDQVPEIINRFSAGKQTLIFCHTKRETERLCATLISNKLGNKKHVHTTAPPGTVDHCLSHGVAFHHAGILPSDKNRIEHAFAAGQIRCLCATSTLAVGVNLPAHLVIVKGTRVWRGGTRGYQDIDNGALLQMIGRAGRPGLDTSGVAVIMTDNKSKSLIEHQIQGLGSAESRLLQNLVDVINTEISQRVVTHMNGAIRWLTTTFLFTRLLKEPTKYAMSPSWKSVDEYMEHLLQRAINNLVEADFVKLDDGGAVEPRPASHIMSQGMVPFEAMQSIASLPHDASMCQILKAMSKMDILSTCVRRNEKRFLNECYKNEIILYKFDGPASKVRIQDPWEKAFVLLQAYIGQYEFTELTLNQQMATIANNAQRMLLAAQDYSVKASRHGFVVLQCLRLRRSLHFNMWKEESGVLNQIDGVGQLVTSKLRLAGIISFQQVLDASDEQLECYSGKAKPFGKQIKSIVSRILQAKLTLSAEIIFTKGSQIAADVICDLRLTDPTAAMMSKSTAGDVSYTLIAYTEQPGSCVLFRNGILGPGTYRFSPPPRFEKLYLHLIGSLIGLDESLVLNGNKTVPASSILETLSRPKQVISSKNIISALHTSHPPKSFHAASDCSGSSGHRKSQPHNETTACRQSPKSIQDPKRKLHYNVEPVEAMIQSPVSTPEPPTIRTETGRSDCQRGHRFQCGHNNVIAQLPHHRIDRIHIDQQPFQANTHKGRSFPSSTPSHERGSDTAPRKVAPITPANPSPVVGSGSPKIDPYQERSVSTSRKRDAPTLWMKSQKKQQRTQQRAFASTRDNPFSFFQHDPNDAEYFLDDLSRQSRPAISNIIPNDMYTGNITGTNPGQRFARLPIYQTQTSNHRWRRQRNIERECSQDILRTKAHEATLYSMQGAPVMQQRWYSAPRQIPLHTIQSSNLHAHPRVLVGVPEDPEGINDGHVTKAWVPSWQGYTFPYETFHDVGPRGQPDHYRDGRHWIDSASSWQNLDVRNVDQYANTTLGELRRSYAAEKDRGYGFASHDMIEKAPPTDEYFPRFPSQQAHYFCSHNPCESSSNTVVPREFY